MHQPAHHYEHRHRYGDAAADSVRGACHRWAAGHDIFVDIMPGFCHAPTEKLHQLGHVLLTDFPTRAGIPIPGCSGSGIWELLTSLGIHKGYLCLNIMDTGIGILAISDASRSLMAALAGDLPMNSWVAFDTFGGGAIEIAAGLGLRTPLLLFAGVEDLPFWVVSAPSPAHFPWARCWASRHSNSAGKPVCAAAPSG